MEGYHFEPYNNWPNKMTWAVFSEIGSDNDIYLTLRDIGESGGQEAVKIQILTWVDQWFERRKVPESVNVFMQSVLSTGIDYAWWWKITDTLLGKSEIEIDNPFTRVVFDAVKTMDWKPLLEDPIMPDESASIEEHVEYLLSSFDARLKDYCRSLLLTWAASRSRRQETPARILARQITQIYLNQVVWERVFRAFIA